MNILCTGGAGFIGSVLVPKLLDANHSVTVLDNFMYCETSLAACVNRPNFQQYKVDCRDLNAIEPYLATADVIIPLAALVGAPICNANPVDAEMINYRIPLAMFHLLAKDQLVIMPTTESAYGSNQEVCDETTPLNPLSTYAQHKVEVEQALMSRENSTSLRLATVFGMSPRMRLDLLINDFTWRAYKEKSLLVFEGHFKRTSVHVRDVARAFIHALDVKPGQIFNVGSISATKIEICEAIKKQLPDFVYVEAPVGTDLDQRNYHVSSDKFWQAGFKSRIGLDEGIAELIKGFRSMRNTRYGNV